MKKILIMLCFPIILSCSNKNIVPEPKFQDIKYFTQNSVEPSKIIKSEINEKKAVIIIFPEYIKQSYDLIKFVSGILSKNANVTLYHPMINTNYNPIEDYLVSNSPLLAFDEFLSLYSYLESKNIIFSDKFINNDGKSIILAPENHYEMILTDVLKEITQEDLLQIEMIGTKRTKEFFGLIKKLPLEKQISSIKAQSDENLVYILYGPIDNYEPITTKLIYNEENYLNAPKDFINSNKSLLKKAQINKMNFALKNRVEKYFKNYGE